MSRPLLVLGLDGLDPTLVAEWGGQGGLTGLRRVEERGSRGRLRSTVNRMTSSAWPTIATGCGPGMHGQFNFAERVPGEYRMRLSTSEQRVLPTFCELAEQNGLRPATVRVPVTYPIGETAGIGIAAWLAPSPQSPGFCWPPELSGELTARFGRRFWLDYVDMGKPRSPRAFRRFADTLLRAVDTGFELLPFVLDRGPFDVVFAAVRETDVAAHALWHLMDATHPRHDPRLARHLGDAVRAVYERVSDGVAALLDSLGDDWNVVIVSDHGAAPNTLGPRCVAPLLEEAGLLRIKPAEPPGIARRLRARLGGLVPWHIRRRFRPLDEATFQRGFTDQILGHVDLQRTLVFTGSAQQVGEIWLNLKGREPTGTVEPGVDEEALIEQISALLLEAVDPATGERPIVEVLRRHDACPGPRNDHIPDLLVPFREGLHVSGLRTRAPDGRAIEVGLPAAASDDPPGFHGPWAYWAAAGPDLARTSEPLEGRLEDVAPTVLALLGLPVPSYMEGAALSAALGEHVRPRTLEVPFDDAALTETQAERVEDEAAVARRLADLGYL